jgi:folate-binding protein YgfZ
MIYHLPERGLIKLFGEDAEAFLQTLVTQDMAKLEPEKLVYACLLTPQGRFLHDFFIFKEHGVFFLECETQRREDLIRRLKIFKLRSKVMIEDCSAAFAVYAGTSGKFIDPRHEELGFRSYLPPAGVATPAIVYKDLRIHLGVPEGSIDIKPETDTLADANLDYLNAVSWTKGCFVGQEVAARMENRGLVKKRMVIVSGSRLTAGDALTQNGHAVGDIRSVSQDRTEGLALLKLAALQDSSPITQADGMTIEARLPDWVKI